MINHQVSRKLFGNYVVDDKKDNPIYLISNLNLLSKLIDSLCVGHGFVLLNLVDKSSFIMILETLFIILKKYKYKIENVSSKTN